MLFNHTKRVQKKNQNAKPNETLYVNWQLPMKTVAPLISFLPCSINHSTTSRTIDLPPRILLQEEAGETECHRGRTLVNCTRHYDWLV